MDRISRCLLNSLRCALRGTALEQSPQLNHDDWDAVFRMAGTHHVLPMVFEAVHSLPELREYPALPALRRSVFQQVMIQTKKTAEFLSLMQTLSDSGIRPLVVKGIVCRELYPKPDHRISSDEDVLISPSQAAMCHEIFSNSGLITDTEECLRETAYEIPYRNPQGALYIELHRYLFPPESAAYGDLNRFFQDASRRAVCHSIGGTEIWSLEYTDHLFYLICHAFKHFLHSGFGIRQVCDIIQYAAAYGKQIHWEQLARNCRQIRALHFAAAIFRIGQNHLGFDPGKADMPSAWRNIAVDEGPMLEDLLQSGIYGGSSLSRRQSSNITLDAVASQKQGRNAQSTLTASLFPDAVKLKGRYPYLNERPWLLPVAWASRIGQYCKDALQHKGADAVQSLDLGKQRLELLEQYHILDRKK